MSTIIHTSSGISIVLIGLNVQRFLPDCLASIRAVHWPQERLEKLYVDSGSTDKSIEIVSQEKDWRILPLNDPAPSVAKGRNLGLAQAQFPYVQFLDADMILDPEWLPLAFRLMEEDGNIAAVFGRTIERYPDRNIYHAIRNVGWAMHPLGSAERIPGASMVRTQVLRACGDHKTDVRGFEDVELAQRIRMRGYTLLGRPEVMDLHDSDMNQFKIYWLRNVRGGEGNYDILRCTEGNVRRLFLTELRRASFWPVLILIGIVASLLSHRSVYTIFPLGLLGLAINREIFRGRRFGGTFKAGVAWAIHWILYKIPYSIGFLKAYMADRKEALGGYGNGNRR